MISQEDVAGVIEELAPASLAEPWDNVGWQVRTGNPKVRGILCTVDVTAAVIDEALNADANLVVAHHPLLFRPLRSVDDATPIGDIVTRAIRKDISILAAHTNWDSAANGVSWALARTLGLEPSEVLIPAPGRPGAGLGVIADVPTTITTDEIIGRIQDELGVGIMGRVGQQQYHMHIALMGGSGTCGIANAARQGATLYITADVRYHDAQEAEALGLALLVMDHGASERPGMASLATLLQDQLRVPVVLSREPTSPWR